MSWTEQNAVKRIFNTFKRVPKQIFKEDIDALKTINESFEFNDIKKVNDNIIYSKVLLLLIKERYFKFNDINSALQSIERDLGYTLEYQIELLTAKIKNNELNEYLKTLSIDVSSLDFDNVEALKEHENRFFDVHQKAIFKKIKELWTMDNISKSFYASANEFLNDVKNYK